MFVSISSRHDLDARDLVEQRAELACPPVIVGEPLDERVERDERRGRRDARLVHARPAEPAQRLVRELDHLGATGEDRPHRRAEALVQADRDRVHRRSQFAEGTPSATAALKSRAPSRWT